MGGGVASYADRRLEIRLVHFPILHPEYQLNLANTPPEA